MRASGGGASRSAWTNCVGAGAFDLDQHALGVVAHEAAEAAARDARP